MAEWKKLVVSGSNISQLNNDAGYLTVGTLLVPNLFSTASFNGTNLLADSPSGSLNFASSSGEGLTISANAGNDTLTFGLSSIPNNSLANSSINIGTTTIALGATGSTLTGLTSVTATNFTGTASFATNADQLDGLQATAFVLNSQTSSMTVQSASFALNASSSLQAGNAQTLQGNSATAFVLNSQTSSMAVSSSLFAVTASFALNVPTATNALTASNITPAITNAADNRVLTANNGGTINGEANLTFDGSTLNLNGNQIISGDLTVNGTTTTINTQNLNVADKFILLSSGSTSATDGGIIIQSAAAGTGFAFLYDAGQARWGYTGSLSGTATTAAPDAFAAMVLDLANGSSDIAAYQKNGNIKIDSGDIYIYA